MLTFYKKLSSAFWRHRHIYIHGKVIINLKKVRERAINQIDSKYTTEKKIYFKILIKIINHQRNIYQEKKRKKGHK